MAVIKGKKQVAQLTNRQFGSEVFHNLLRQISNLAGGVSEILNKGIANQVDPRTGQSTGQKIKLRCSVDDIKRAGSPEQLGAVEEFISVWAPVEEVIEVPKPPKQKRK